MRIRAIAAVACKVLAVYVVLVALDFFQRFFPFQATVTDSRATSNLSETARLFLGLGICILPAILLAAGAALLWFQSDRVAVWMVPNPNLFESERPVPPGFVKGAQTAALVVVGVALIALTIPSLVYYVWSAISPTDGWAWTAWTITHMVITVLKLAIGVGLVAGAPKILRWVTWLRTAGRSRQRPEGTE